MRTLTIAAMIIALAFATSAQAKYCVTQCYTNAYGQQTCYTNCW